MTLPKPVWRILIPILILLWKNLLLRKRRPFMTSLEVLLPCLYVIILFYGNTQENQGQKDRAENSPPWIPRQSYKFQDLTNIQTTVAYTPSTPLIQTVVAKMKALASSVKFKKFDSEGEIEAVVRKQYKAKDRIDSAIVFGEGFNFDISPSHPPPTNLKLAYKIRVVTDAYKKTTVTTTPWTDKIFHDRLSSYDTSVASKKYKSHGFVGLQILADRAVIDVLTNKPNNYPTNLHALSYPLSVVPDKPSKLDQVFSIYPALVGLGYIVLLPAVLMETVGEKETGVKELTRVSGVPNWMHLVGWVLNFALTSIVSTSVIVLLMFFPGANGALIVNGSAAMFWIALFLYCMQTVAFCLLLAAIFERVWYPLVISVSVSVLTLFSFSPISYYFYTKLGLGFKLLVCIFPNGALSMFSFVIGHITSRDDASFFGDLYRPMRLYQGDSLSVGLVLAAMLLTTILCLVLSLYLESVLPSTHGARKRWNYIFKRETWVSRSAPLSTTSHPSGEDMTKEEDNFEAEPSDADIGIEIKKLRKVFRGGKVGVSDVSLNILQGQITVLLGPNGAGKSTLMAMLAGVTSPTSGTAIVNGFDISSDLSGARKSLGLCPQLNLHFNQLTVKQHLIFFAMLKGVGYKDLSSEIDPLLQRMNLGDKKDLMASQLSGGEKRKLSLCVALVGGSQTVILDEPTAGMDPEARRGVWDLLSEARSSRTILLTTYHKGEADVLGDRVVIMDQGKLKCCGSPSFLKSRYGISCMLCAKLSRPTAPAKILGAVQQHAPGAFLKPSLNPQIMVIVALPPVDDSSTLSKLCTSIEARKGELNIASLDMNIANLSDVLESVVEEAGQEKVSSYSAQPTPTPSGRSVDREHNSGFSDSKDAGKLSLSHTKVTPALGSEHSELAVPPQASSGSNLASVQASAEEVVVTGDGRDPKKRRSKGRSLFCQQFVAIILKRFWFTWRNKTLLILQIVLPLLMVASGIVLGNLAYVDKDPTPLPPLVISLGSYPSPVVLFEAATAGRDFATAFASVVGSPAKEVGAGQELLLELENVQFKKLEEFRSSYVVAASFQANKTIAMFSTIPYHTFPLAVNLMNNAWLKHVLPDKNIRIQVTAHPLHAGIPAVKAYIDKMETQNAWLYFPLLFASIFAGGIVLCTATFVIFPAEERLSKVKQLQLMTGINPLTFWGASFLFDYALMLLISLLVLASLPVFQVHGAYTAYSAPGALLVIVMSYGFAAIWFAYAVSLFVVTPTRGIAVVVISNIFFGTLLVGIFNVLLFLPLLREPPEKTTTPGLISLIPFFGRIVPLFGFICMCMSFATTLLYNSECLGVSDSDKEILCDFDGSVSVEQLKTCCAPCKSIGFTYKKMCFSFLYPECFDPEPYMKWRPTPPVPGDDIFPSPCDLRPWILQEAVFELITGSIYMGIVLFVEFKLVRRLQSLFLRNNKKSNSSVKASNLEKDTEVIEEEYRVQEMIRKGPIDDAIVVSNVRKVYGNFVAVSGLNFGVHPGECFGLVGLSGAGTTTTLKLLTGDVMRSSGNAFLSPCVIADRTYRKSDLARSPMSFFKCIGYCPQEDNAIFGVLTGVEMLKLFSRLRGGAGDVQGEAVRWLQKLGLAGSEKVESNNYSGGMKRRLSVAMAMIGEPPVVLLDEPTSGVDPGARRMLWGVLQSAHHKSGQTIILTSHSMEEVEALCSRLGIMVNGELQCFGETSHLKDNYGQGFIVSLKLKTLPSSQEVEAQREELKDAILQSFVPCRIVEEHQNAIHAHVNNGELSWAERFGIAEELKQSFPGLVQDYTLKDASLEDVFLVFARRNYPGDERTLKLKG